MRNFRCMLLCFSLLSAVSLTAGCSCGNAKNETTASFPAETSSAGREETTTRETTIQPGTSAGDIYETGNGTHNPTNEYENGAGSMGTDEGILPDTDHGTDYGTDHGTDYGTDHGTDGGLMEDVTDGLERIGEDITGAVDDVVDGTRAHRNR